MTKTHFDWMIVGAGFTGAVLAERLASQADKRVLIIDRRDHLAGNAYDCRNEDGHLVHQYGPHIFHTNSTAVADYLSRFTPWRAYEHRVVGLIDGRLVPIPFNLTSLNILFEPAQAQKVQELLIAEYGYGQKVPILKLKEVGDAHIQGLAEYIYQKVFYNYTRKQWGLEPEELSASVTARVPVNISHDDRYFADQFQAMPANGYAAMFEKILDHPNIKIELCLEYDEAHRRYSSDHVIYTGAVDEFFQYDLGALPYRSLRFDFQTYQQSRHQVVGTVNFPNDHAFTRISEMSHVTGQWADSTVVTLEYPQEHRPGETIPYYPIPRDKNMALHKRYTQLAEREAANVRFAGRLGDYRYYNMDQAVGHALAIFAKGDWT